MFKTTLSAVLAFIALLCTSACDSSVSNEKGLKIIALAKAAMGGNAWDGIEIRHERGQIISVPGETTAPRASHALRVE
jgi:hypothetical protein